MFREYEAKNLLKDQIVMFVDTQEERELTVFESDLMIEFNHRRNWGRGVILESIEELGVLGDEYYIAELRSMRADGGYTHNYEFVEVPEWRS